MVQTTKLSIDEANAAAGLTPSTGQIKPDPTRFSMGRKTQAAFRLENSYASYYASAYNDPGVPTEQEDLDFRSGKWQPLTAVKGTLLDTPDYWGKVAQTKSQRELDALTLNVSREREDRKVLDTLGFFPTLGYTMFAATLDPTMLAAAMVPGLLTARGARMLATGSALTVTSETALQATQHERTLEESALNVAGDFVIGGVLGHISSKTRNGKVEEVVTGEQRANTVKEYDDMREAMTQQDYIDRLLSENDKFDGELLPAKMTDDEAVEWMERLLRDPDQIESPTTKAKAADADEIDPMFDTDTVDEPTIIGMDADGEPIFASDPARPGFGTGIGSAYNDEVLEQLIPGRVAALNKAMESGEMSKKAGARQLYRELKEATNLKDAKLIKWSAYAHPGMQLAQSELPTMRVVGMQLVDDVYIRNFNKTGTALDVQPVSVGIKHLQDTVVNIPIHESFERNYAAYSDRAFKMQEYKPIPKAASDLNAKRKGLMTSSEFEQEAYEAVASRGGLSDIPEVQAYANDIMAIVKKVNDEAIDSGYISGKAVDEIDVPHIGDEGVIPRVYNKEKMTINSSEFIGRATDDFINQLDTIHSKKLQEIVDELEMNRNDVLDDMYGEMHALAAKFQQKIVKSPTGFIASKGILYPKDGVYSAWLKGTRFDITTTSLTGRPGTTKFIETETSAVMNVWGRNMAPRIELARRFDGDPAMVEAKATLEAEFNESLESRMVDKFSEEDVRAKDQYDNTGDDLPDNLKAMVAHETSLKKQFADEMQTMENIRRYMLHEFDNPADPSAMFNKGLNGIKWFTFMTKLGGMGLSSITDVGSAIARQGLRPFSASLGKMAVSMGAGMARHEALKWGAGIDVIMASRMNQIGMLNDITSFGKWEKVMSDSSQFFSKATGMAQWNAVMKQLAALSTADSLVKLSLKDTLNAKELSFLSRMGISAENWKSLKNEIYNTHSDVDGWLIPNVDDFERQDLADLFKQAAIRMADSSIVTPGPGDIPFAARTQLGQVLFQFKSFLFTTNNQVVIPGIQQRDANTITAVASMVALGAASFAMKEIAAGRGDELGGISGDQWIKEGIDRSGVLGLLWSADTLLSDITGQAVSVQDQIFDAPPTSNVMAQSSVNDLIGPWYGTAQDAMGASRAATRAMLGGDVEPSDIAASRRLIPYQNLFYLRQAFDKLETAAGGRDFE